MLREIVISENNQNYLSLNGVLYTKDMKSLVAYPSQKQTSAYTVPAIVETIGIQSFRGVQALKELSFAEGSQLKLIAESAFQQSQLRIIHLPSTLQKIDQNAFYYMESMSVISIPISVTEMGLNVFGGNDMIVYYEGLSIPGTWSYNWAQQNIHVILGETLQISTINGMQFVIIDNEATFLGVDSDFTNTHLDIPETILDGTVKVTKIEWCINQ